MKNRTKYNRGFTLIELMVVVAIVSIVLAIVFASLGSARDKGQDASIQSEMKSLQNQIEVTFAGGNYDGLFTNNTWASDNTKIQVFLTSIDKQTTVHTAGSSVSAWAAQVQLRQEANKYFCVDTSGKGSTSTTALLPGGVVCP